MTVINNEGEAMSLRRRGMYIPDADKPVCPDHNIVMVFSPDHNYWRCPNALCKKIAQPIEDEQLALDIPVIDQKTGAAVKVNDDPWGQAVTVTHTLNDVMAAVMPVVGDQIPVPPTVTQNITSASTHDEVTKQLKKIDGVIKTACLLSVHNAKAPFEKQEFYIQTEDGIDIDITPLIERSDVGATVSVRFAIDGVDIYP